MPNAVPVDPINPTITNPPVALATGVVPRGDGFGQPTDAFLFDLGQEAYSSASITTVVTGAPASLTLQLQGSMDGNTWSTIATSTSTTGDTQFSNSGFQFTSLRVNVSAVSGGTSPKVGFAITAWATTPAGTAQTVTGAVRLTDNVNNVAVAAPTGGSVTGPALEVSTGTITAGTAQSAATTGNGTVIDFGAAKRSVAFQVTATGTVTAGQVTLEVSADGVNFSAPPTAAFTNDSAATLANPYVLVTNTTALFVVTNASVRYARARITTNVTGGATCTVVISAS